MRTSDTGSFDAASVPASYRRYLEPVIFEPWAKRLLDIADLQLGQVILDVASGTGVVASEAARRVGPTGRVIAADISPAMLAEVAGRAGSRTASIEPVECSATELRVPDASVDVVLCQQGLQFIRQAQAAVHEMRRVLRPGGLAAVAVWLAGERLEPFDTYAEEIEAAGIAEPFPHAYDKNHFTRSAEQLEKMFAAAGFGDIVSTTARQELQWPTAEHAAHGITGTPYGPSVSALDAARQRELFSRLEQRMSGADGGPVQLVTTAVISRAVAP